jgi:hypothetical protein
MQASYEIIPLGKAIGASEALLLARVTCCQPAAAHTHIQQTPGN